MKKAKGLDEYRSMDPAYEMSMPSQNPLDELGYTQFHQQALANPLSRMTWDPSMHFYPEAGVPRAWGAVNSLKADGKSKYKWGDPTESNPKRNKAMYNAINKAFPKGSPDHKKALEEAVFLDQALRGEGMVFSEEFGRYRPDIDQTRAATLEIGKKGNTPMHEEMHKGLMELHKKGKVKRPLKDKGDWDHDIIDMYYYKHGTEYQKTEAKKNLMDKYSHMSVVDKVLGKRLDTVLQSAANLFEDKSAFEEVLKANDTREKKRKNNAEKR